MPPASRSPRASARPGASGLSWLLLALGVAGFTALWVTLGAFNGRVNGWMAVLGALDVVVLLRLGRWRPGPVRIALALAATAAIVALSNWGIIAAQLGRMLGLLPWESALRLGSHHAWTLAQLANGPVELAWFTVAAVVAVWGAR